MRYCSGLSSLYVQPPASFVSCLLSHFSHHNRIQKAKQNSFENHAKRFNFEVGRGRPSPWLSFGLDPPPAPSFVLSLGIPPLDRLRSVTIKEQSLLENRLLSNWKFSAALELAFFLLLLVRGAAAEAGIFLAECVKKMENIVSRRKLGEELSSTTWKLIRFRIGS